jgi:hypothetical protein
MKHFETDLPDGYYSCILPISGEGLWSGENEREEPMVVLFLMAPLSDPNWHQAIM